MQETLEAPPTRTATVVLPTSTAIPPPKTSTSLAPPTAGAVVGACSLLNHTDLLDP